jgi:hypothetical protein
MEGNGRGLILMYYTGICVEGLSKPRKPQNSRNPGRGLNPGPPEYKAGPTKT